MLVRLIHLSPLWGLLLVGSMRGLYTFRLSDALENHISAPAECHTRIHSVDLAECHTRIHSVDFGAEGVYRTRIPENQLCERYEDRIGFIYNPTRRGNILKLILMVIGKRLHNQR